MSKFVYSYSDNFSSKVPAQVAGEELEKIRKGNKGKLETQVIVDKSRPEEAPLHPIFEWDDWKAAESYRRDQARHLVRAIRIQRNDMPNENPKRHYINVPAIKETEESQAYERLQDAILSPEKRALLQAKAWQDLIAFKARYLEILKLCNDESLKQIGKIIAERELSEAS